MHGAVHDYVVLKTVHNGKTYQTGETHDRYTVQEVTPFKTIKLPTEQRQYPRLLEIGSLDLIGSMRSYDFMGTASLWSQVIGVQEYIGIDLVAGKSVDVVMNAHQMQFQDSSFDIVICLQMLEHDDDPQKTIQEAFRVLRDGQPFILTCASAEHPEHADLGGGSHTYTHIHEKDVRKWLTSAGFIDAEITKQGSNFYIYAVKPKSAEVKVGALKLNLPKKKTRGRKKK